MSNLIKRIPSLNGFTARLVANGTEPEITIYDLPYAADPAMLAMVTQRTPAIAQHVHKLKIDSRPGYTLTRAGVRELLAYFKALVPRTPKTIASRLAIIPWIENDLLSAMDVFAAELAAMAPAAPRIILDIKLPGKLTFSTYLEHEPGEAITLMVNGTTKSFTAAELAHQLGML